MTTTLPEPGILYARVFVVGIMVLMYGYNILRAYRVWHRSRGWETFRQFIMAFELMFGIFLIFTGYVNAAFFAQNAFMTDVLRAFGYLLLGVLLVGGGTLVLSWRRPPPDGDRRNENRRATDDLLRL